MSHFKSFVCLQPETVLVTSPKENITTTSVSAQEPRHSPDMPVNIPDLLNCLDMRTKPQTLFRTV